MRLVITLLIILLLLLLLLFFKIKKSKNLVNEKVLKEDDVMQVVENKQIEQKENINEGFETTFLPNIYYTNEIVLMPKSTNCVFSYWEVKDDTYIELKNKENVYDDIVIRVYKHNQFYREIKNLPRVGSCYINNLDVNSDYYLIAGFENESNNFFEIARSNTVITPNNQPSEYESELWGISEIVNGQIKINYYNKENLPKEFIFNQEILDKQLLYKEESIYNIELGASENNTNNFTGSSNNLK